MPGSSAEGKDAIHYWLLQFGNHIKTVLDVGAGSGTYADCFRKITTPLANAHWTAIEIWEPYINGFKLNNLYERVINADMRTFDYTTLGQMDLAFVGDVLEHVTKEEAQQVVNNLLRTCKIVIISIPIVHFPQDIEFGNPHEIHVKDDWSHEEVMSSFTNIRDYKQGDTIGVYLLIR